ncbi:Fur family transcriptional regulator [Streptomyces collinus]|uniref:Fur family ferric uptake transcriptional regulator n=1 Tax=Streptomyces collinus TaxID=42684 RepID=A0AA89Q9F4_STRCU|nr:transcriptional repressor [Streptomyces collinus]MBB5816692.1 Fur family ferric uptake transcriptional regulator [Streptomyces collinus]WMX62045.1 transcriptional repressor [Streptomyces collinus]
MYGTTPGAWRTTPQRTAVLTALRACDGFISAQTLHAALLAEGVAVGLTTVYRTLRLLETAGHVDVVRDSDGERLYRPRPDEGHRHYLVCRECGLSLAVDAEEVERWVTRTARDIGFHTVELTGVCDGCLSGPDRRTAPDT